MNGVGDGVASRRVGFGAQHPVQFGKSARGIGAEIVQRLEEVAQCLKVGTAAGFSALKLGADAVIWAATLPSRVRPHPGPLPPGEGRLTPAAIIMRRRFRTGGREIVEATVP